MRKGWGNWDCLAWRREGWGDLTVAFQNLKGAYKQEGERLFMRVDSGKARGNGFKLRQGRFRSGGSFSWIFLFYDFSMVYMKWIFQPLFTFGFRAHHESPSEQTSTSTLGARFMQHRELIILQHSELLLIINQDHCQCRGDISDMLLILNLISRLIVDLTLEECYLCSYHPHQWY